MSPKRRRASLLAALLSWACSTPPPEETTRPEVAAVTTRELDGIRIHVIQTGWVRVKQAHRTLSGPEATRLLSIVLDRDATEWLPVLVGVIEHPEGVFLVDAGLDERIHAIDELTDDGGNRWVYRNLLQFRFDPAERIDRRLEALGIDLARLRGVVLTHQHADHTAGLAHLPSDVPIYLGAADRQGHQGSIAALLPGDRTVVAVEEPVAEAGGVARARDLTSDGAVSIVALAGHSPGHLGVLVRGQALDVLFIGDAAFDRQQIEQEIIAGIVEEPDRARETLRTIAAQLAARPTKLVLAHDPVTLAELTRE